MLDLVFPIFPFLHRPKLNLCSASPMWRTSLCATGNVTPFHAWYFLRVLPKLAPQPLPAVAHLSRASVQNSHHVAALQGAGSQGPGSFTNGGKMEWSRRRAWWWWMDGWRHDDGLKSAMEDLYVCGGVSSRWRSQYVKAHLPVEAPVVSRL